MKTPWDLGYEQRGEKGNSVKRDAGGEESKEMYSPRRTARPLVVHTYWQTG